MKRRRIDSGNAAHDAHATAQIRAELMRAGLLPPDAGPRRRKTPSTPLLPAGALSVARFLAAHLGPLLFAALALLLVSLLG